MEIDDKLKNRLAGAAVVTVLAVIFLPMMFDDPVAKKGQVVSEIDIPRKPEVSPLLTTAIVPDKSAEVANETKEPLLAAKAANTASTGNLTDSTDSSNTEFEEEKLPLDSEPVEIESESPAPEKKKAAKKEPLLASHFDESAEAVEKKKTHKKEKTSSPHSNDAVEAIEKKKTHKKEMLAAESVVESAAPPKPIKHKEPKKAAVIEEEKKTVKAKFEKKAVKPELPVLDAKYRDENNTAATKKLPELDNHRWVVQVASLSDQAKANAFRDKLRAQGFPANVESAWISGKGRVYRLKVGPELDAQKAHAIQDKINQLHNVKSIAISE